MRCFYKSATVNPIFFSKNRTKKQNYVYKKIETIPLPRL
jgi:hypothetical protein